ncbi:MAG: hypothetical protein PHC60_00040 [Heliobacteriaceae bacterium]|nr:hypothetical protein [Heliobacteriaceae bacterium]MDD4586773.1 hypothetical protein [Heliobacteriaceae bacterium]
MPYLSSWSTGQILIAFTAVAFLLVTIQVTLFHYRQNFRHYAMWGPVIGLPLAALAGLMLTWQNTPFWYWVFLVLLWVELASGLVGFYLHSRGITQRVGGWGINNVLIGPPPVLPLMVSALAVLGLFALYL